MHYCYEIVYDITQIFNVGGKSFEMDCIGEIKKIYIQVSFVLGLLIR